MSNNGAKLSKSQRQQRRAPHRDGGFVRADLKAYLDGELSAVRIWIVRWHLARCPECREEVAWLQRLGEDMRELESARPRPALRSRILASLPDTPPVPYRRLPLDRVTRGGGARRGAPGLAFGGAFAMLMVGGFALTHHPAPVHTTAPATLAVSAPVSPPPASNTSTVETPSTDVPTPTQAMSGRSGDAGYTDETSRKAQELLDRDNAQEAANKRLRLTHAWKTLLADARHNKTQGTPPTIRLALTVPSLGWARTALRTWGQQQGIAIADAAPTSANPQGKAAASTPDSAPTNEIASAQGTTETPAPGSVIVLKVPAARGRDVLKELEQVGTWSRVVAATTASGVGNRPQGLSTVTHAEINQVAPSSRVAPPLTTGAAGAANPKAAPLHSTPPHTPANSASPAPAPSSTSGKYITIRIQLQQSNPSPY